MNLIVAVSSDWGIGYKNDLLFRIREDLRNFKKLTTNKIVVMGYNTLLSLPDSKPLPNRVNIVLSRKKNLEISGAIVCNSLENLEEVLSAYDQKDVFVIGGENVYAQLINRCTTAYITKVEANPPADAFFPNFDELADWRAEKEYFPSEKSDIPHKYTVYVKNSG